jgi:folate-binding protein YgfZ
MPSQAVELPNPLYSLHEQAEAEFQAYAQLQIVSTFGEPQAEYAALHKACGMMDLPQRGILQLTGKDRLTFLNNLLTNKTWDKETKTGLKQGEGVYAFFLNGKGRIVVDMNVLECGDRTLLDMDARFVGQIRTTFDKYLFAEQVQMQNQTASLHQIALGGPGSHEILGLTNGELQPLASKQIILFETPVTVYRDDSTGSAGHVLIVPTEAAKNIWMNLLARFGTATETGKRPLRPVGWAAFNAVRIEAGQPIFGIDFDDSVLPAETGQFNRAVSITKGCYLGQEIVARMHARQIVARQLTGIRMDNDALPLAGTKIFDDANNEIGGITSSTLSPMLSNTAIALGFLKRPFFAPGTAVNVPAEGSLRKATVVELPFLK